MAVTRMTRAEYQAQFGTPAPETSNVDMGQFSSSSQQKTPFVNKVANFFGAKGLTDAIGATMAQKQNPEIAQYVDRPTGKQVLGSAIQTGANFIPGVGKGLGLAAKTAIGAGTGLAFDAGSQMQAGQPVKPSFGTAVGAGIPVAGAVIKPAAKIVGRLFKGLGSGLSGVSTETIDKIVSNPKAAQLATEKIAKSGNAKVLEDNARQLMGGISTIKKEARGAYKKGLEELAETDIDPAVFRQNTQKALDKFGSTVSGGKRVLTNVEFDDPKNLSKASSFIDRLQGAELNGKSLRKLADDIESSKYKTVSGSNEKMSFNAFLDDLAGSLKGAVSASTGKLDEINKSFSKDMQLAEAVENIFGKVKFKNLPEVVKATQRLENLFAQKGIAPDVVDDFLRRIGVSPEDFKTTEAVRQISNKSQKANEVGLGVGELIRGVTSAVVTPQMVRDVSTKVGLAENVLAPELQKLSPAVRGVLLNFIVQMDK